MLKSSSAPRKLKTANLHINRPFMLGKITNAIFSQMQRINYSKRKDPMKYTKQALDILKDYYCQSSCSVQHSATGRVNCFVAVAGL